MCRKPYYNKELGILCPCGQCEDCLNKRIQDWTLRMCNELEDCNGEAVFLTLTYAPDYVPQHYSLRKKDLQDYFKRVRKHYTVKPIRYYASGEYGERSSRPHYHVIMYGIAPNAYRELQMRRNVWPYGHTEIGHSVTAESCAYTAKYVSKMIRTKGYDYSPRERPFQVQSQGLGKRYAQRYAQTIKKNYT